LEQKLSDDVVFDAGICQNCFIKFNEHDEHLSISNRIQKEIVSLYMYSSSSLEADMKLDIKREIDSDYGIVEVMLDDDVSDASDIFTKTKFVKRSPKKSKSPRASSNYENNEKRSYKRKKNLDEGLIVVEVDG
jgi:hypothetical protein